MNWRTCETCHSYRAAGATGPCPVCGSGLCQRCGEPGYGFVGREWLCEGCMYPSPALNAQGTGIVRAVALGMVLATVFAIGGLV